MKKSKKLHLSVLKDISQDSKLVSCCNSPCGGSHSILSLTRKKSKEKEIKGKECKADCVSKPYVVVFSYVEASFLRFLILQRSRLQLLWY